MTGDDRPTPAPQPAKEGLFPLGGRIPDDLVLPFQVEQTGARGRLARLGPLVDDILTRHNYPDPVSQVLGEALVLAGLLGSALKFDGTLTLQTHAEGPVPMLVASFKAPNGLRGYAMLDKERWAALEREGKADAEAVLGQGHFALTIDPGAGMQRYQGLVPITPGGITACAHEYFMQSEQIATRLRLAVGRDYRPRSSGQTAAKTGAEARAAESGGAVWRAGGIMVQHLAAEGGLTDEDERAARIAAREARDGPTLTDTGERVEDAWERVALLLDTVEDHELLDPLLEPERLLLRLFHEDGVRVYDKTALAMDCRCTPERLRKVLAQYAGDELDDLMVDGRIVMRCEFCSRDFDFDPAEVRQAEAPKAGENG